MAIAVLDIPVMNPLRFVPVDGELPKDPRCNINHFDEGWFADYIRDWQTKTDYIQKWQQNDIISFQFHANTPRGWSLDIYDCHGRNWGTLSAGILATIAGVSAQVGTSTIALNTFGKSFRVSTLNLPDGIYWFYLTVIYDLNNDTVADYWRHCITEPMSIAQKHYGTTITDYAHNTNKAGIVFKQVKPRFSIRVEADIVDYGFASIDSQFEDEGYSASLLASTTYRTAKFATTARLPEWMWEKLNEAWSCSSVRVDNKVFTKEIGAKWEPNRIARLPKVALVLQIREANNNTKNLQIVASTIVVFPIASYPFAIYDVSLISTTTSFDMGMPVTIIHNLTELNTYVSSLNTSAFNQFLNGSFSVSGSDVIWTNGANDDIIGKTGSVVSNPFTYVLNASTAAPITFSGGTLTVDWGDGNVDQLTAFGTATLSHNYGSTASRTVSVFGNPGKLSFQDNNMNTPGGTISNGTTEFAIVGGIFTSFDCAILAPAATYLEKLFVAFVGITSISNYAAQPFANLTQVSFAGNALSTTNASNVVVDTYTIASNANIYSGTLYVTQIPAAPLNSTGLAYKSFLGSSYQWQVYNN